MDWCSLLRTGTRINFLFLFFCGHTQVPFFTLPPEDDDSRREGLAGAKAAEAVFVEGFDKEFDVEAGDAEVG